MNELLNGIPWRPIVPFLSSTNIRSFVDRENKDTYFNDFQIKVKEVAYDKAKEY